MIVFGLTLRGRGWRITYLGPDTPTGTVAEAAAKVHPDAVVISAEEGLHKPQPEIYLLAAERVGLDARECVFVDDLRENCAGAEAVGMTAVLHRGAERTLPRLEELLGVGLV